MPPRSLSGDFSGATGMEAPPSYDHILSVQEFEQKAANVAEQTANEAQHHDSGPADSKGKRTVTDEFEDWDDEKFARAAAAYQARQMAKQMEQGSRQNGAGSSSTASNYRSMSPSRPGPSSQYASLPASHTSPIPQNAAQLPTPASYSPSTQRTLPPRPMDQYQTAGPLSPPQVPAFSSVSDVKSSAPWMQSGFSDDGHGRSSMDAPPPFAPIASPTSEYSEPTGIPYADTRGSIVGDRPTQSAPSATFRNIPPPPRLNTTTLPPSPPASAPAFQTSARSPPPPPLPSSQSAPQSAHRYSEPPSATTPSSNSRLPYPPQPQRRSDIPNPNQRPPSFVATRPPMIDKKPSFITEQPSAGSQLYASATSRAGGPTVRPDYSRIAYQSHAPAGPRDNAPHDPSAFYSSSVSSVLSKRALPPQPRRQPTTDTPAQFTQPYSNPYAASSFYNQPAQNVNVSQGYYTQPQQPLYSNQFQAPVQQQPIPPQGYPSATQNNWAPAPPTWQNQGRY